VVRAQTGLRQGTPTDDAALVLAANAAAEYVEELRPELFLPGELPEDPAVFTPTHRVKLAAAMLAHRWYSRRSSPLGVAGYGELGSAGILRYDPDIARLLGIGSESGRFVFGAPTVPTEESTS
jgi:hypothetical protein